MGKHARVISQSKVWGLDILILVTLGTQDKSFIRLVKEIDKLVEEKVIKEKVIVQLGLTDYKSKNLETFSLIESVKLNELIKKADILITHGGVGSILSGLSYDKKVIAVPRLSMYKEHTNDHQIQIVNEFCKLGYILKCDDPKDLKDVLKQAKTFKPKKYKSNTLNMVKMIADYIDAI